MDIRHRHAMYSMKRLAPIFFLLVTVIGLGSCNRKWKKATKVAVYLETVRFEGNTSQNAGPETLLYKSGHMRIINIQLIGERYQADGIDFERNESVQYDFATGSALAYQFDIPQGTYSDFDVDLQAGNAGTEPGIKLLMVWVNSASEEVNVEFKLRRQDVYHCVAKEVDGSEQIDLVADENRDMVITLDFDQWFSFITPEMWDDAERFGTSNFQVKIDESNNSDLYHQIADRIGDGISVQYQ